MNNNEVWRHENWNFFGTFFQRSSRLVKVMVKLWGGVSSILIEGVRPTFIHLLIFYWFYWFLSILLIFYRFHWFLSILLIFIDFIDFSTILLIFQRFYPFLFVFYQFCLFSTYVNKFSPIYRAYVFLKCCVMYNIDQVLLWGVTDLCIQPRGCFYSRNTENF